MKGETQTLRARCSKAEPKKIRPPPRPTSQGRRTAEIKSAGDGHYLYLHTQFGEDRCTQFRVIAVTVPPTNTQSHKHTDRTDYNTLRRSLARSVTSCAEGHHTIPPPLTLTFDLIALKVLSESRVTRATSVPISVLLGLSVLDWGPMYATDWQTSDSIIS